jgi:hypothetical protein
MRKWKESLILTAIFGIVFSACFICSAQEDFLKKGREGDIAFLSGGVGQSEREILKEMGKDYPLKLIFSKKSGEYLSDVGVKILGQKDQSIFTTVSNGPWLFINLPPGTYCLEANFKGEQKRISQVKIEKGSQKVLFLQW